MSTILEFENLRLKNQLCFALYSATHTIVRFYTSKLAAVGLTYPQYLVLVVLWERDGISVKQLAETLDLDSGTLTPILKRLQAGGLVLRKRNSTDERIVNLMLTKDGFGLRKRVAQIQKLVACQTGLPHAEFVGMRRKLNELVKTMNVNRGAKIAVYPRRSNAFSP